MTTINITMLKKCCKQGSDQFRQIITELEKNSISVIPLVRNYYYEPGIRDMFGQKGIQYNSKVPWFIVREMDNFVFNGDNLEESVIAIKYYFSSYKDRTVNK